MTKTGKALMGGLLAASALVAPGSAWARPLSVEARLERLEAEMKGLRGDLEATRAENSQLRQRAADAEARAALAEGQAADASKHVAAMEAKPAPVQADGFKSGNTQIKLGGYIKLLASSTRYSDGEVANNSLGRDFYLPQTIPTGGQPAVSDTDFTAKQSRFWLNLDSNVAGKAVKGYLEFDFQT